MLTLTRPLSLQKQQAVLSCPGPESASTAGPQQESQGVLPIKLCVTLSCT